MLGIKVLIFEGIDEGKNWWTIYINNDGIRFDDANDLTGQGVYESASHLIEKYGRQTAISLIGPGGEMQLLTAGIQNLDKNSTPSRINARGGLGALMGSRHIKAIVFDPAGCSKPPIVHPEEFKAAQKKFTTALLEHPQTAVYKDYGTAGVGRLCNSLGALPTLGFSLGEFDEFENISGENLRQTIIDRGGDGDPSHACMAGCIIRCSNIFPDTSGQESVSPLEYETIGLMGSNLGISDLDIIAKLNKQVNDLGIDSIDIGAALGIAAQAGLMNFGDGERASEIIEEIRKGTPLGRIIGNGAAMSGKVLGIQRVPVVKNQAISAYDPRAIKGTGVTYATSPQGADHTAGLTIRVKTDHTDPKGQAALSRNAQLNNAGYDTLGACVFAGFGFTAASESIRDLLNSRYGWKVDVTILQELGRQTIKTEVEFNRQAGFTSADNRIPEWMTLEPLSPTQAVFDVPDEDLDGIFNW